MIKTVNFFVFLVFGTIQNLVQTVNLAGTYTVSANPKEILKIKKLPQHGYFVESNQGWTGTIFYYDKTRFDGAWQYSETHPTKQLRGLAGEHVCVVHKDSSLTVTITPFDTRWPTSVVKWQKNKTRTFR